VTTYGAPGADRRLGSSRLLILRPAIKPVHERERLTCRPGTRMQAIPGNGSCDVRGASAVRRPREAERPAGPAHAVVVLAGASGLDRAVHM